MIKVDEEKAYHLPDCPTIVYVRDTVANVEVSFVEGGRRSNQLYYKEALEKIARFIEKRKVA